MDEELQFINDIDIRVMHISYCNKIRPFNLIIAIYFKENIAINDFKLQNYRGSVFNSMPRGVTYYFESKCMCIYFCQPIYLFF